MSAKSVPTVQPGPLVHGRPTVLRLMTTAEFLSSPLATAVTALANEAFRNVSAPWIADTFHRFKDPASFVAELGEKPNGEAPYISLFVLAFEHPEPSDDFDGMVATSGCKPVSSHVTKEAWEALSEPMVKIWVRNGALAEPIDGVVDWVLKIVTTALSCTRQGVAGWMIKKAEDEIKRRTEKALHAGPGFGEADWDVKKVLRDRPAGPADGDLIRIRVMLTALEENNRAYYERHGYVHVGGLLAPAGTGGGTQQFHVAHMDKYLSL